MPNFNPPTLSLYRAHTKKAGPPLTFDTRPINIKGDRQECLPNDSNKQQRAGTAINNDSGERDSGDRTTNRRGYSLLPTFIQAVCKGTIKCQCSLYQFDPKGPDQLERKRAS